MKPNKILVEVCVDSLKDAIQAQDAGADRIELCASLDDGGLTPSIGLIELCCERLHIPVYAMIRPRPGHFCYSSNELETMQRDIKHAKAAGSKGVVFGVLDANHEVDIATTMALISAARPMQVTFHRAFDQTPKPEKALEQIISCGADWLLTSGQQQTAVAGLALIKTLVEKAAGRISILAGSGVSPANAMELVSSDIQALHFTSRKQVQTKDVPQNFIEMGTNSSADRRYLFDEEKAEAIIKLIR